MQIVFPASDLCSLVFFALLFFCSFLSWKINRILLSSSHSKGTGRQGDAGIAILMQCQGHYQMQMRFGLCAAIFLSQKHPWNLHPPGLTFQGMRWEPWPSCASHSHVWCAAYTLRHGVVTHEVGMLAATTQHLMRTQCDNALTVPSIVFGIIMFRILLMMIMMMVMDFACGPLSSKASFTLKTSSGALSTILPFLT